MSRSTDGTSRPEASKPIELSTRLALRPREAAAALGICERTLRELQPELPTVRVGRSLLYPVRELEAWLSRRASTEKNELDSVVASVLDDLR
jgi:hypothetical protein